MSYDIRLTDPLTGETLELPIKHVMTGGTYVAGYDEETRSFHPKPISKAWLNITYNYGKFYYEALQKEFNGKDDNLGIRILYGKSGAESLKWLDQMIDEMKSSYPRRETDTDYWKATPGNAMKPLFQLRAMAELRPDGIWDGD